MCSPNNANRQGKLKNFGDPQDSDNREMNGNTTNLFEDQAHTALKIIRKVVANACASRFFFDAS